MCQKQLQLLGIVNCAYANVCIRSRSLLHSPFDGIVCRDKRPIQHSLSGGWQIQIRLFNLQTISHQLNVARHHYIFTRSGMLKLNVRSVCSCILRCESSHSSGSPNVSSDSMQLNLNAIFLENKFSPIPDAFRAAILFLLSHRH